jgi:hypothetical protein
MLYSPFEHLDFNDRTCFLTGTAATERITAFPGWILDRFDLAGKPFKLLDESVVVYRDITAPCSFDACIAMEALDVQIRTAFETGFEAVKRLPEIALFQWIGKLMYAILHHEVRIGIRQQAMAGEQMQFSRSLIHRFSHFHYMLQSLVRPIVFEGVMPWSIAVVKVDHPAAAFSYRDEINTLTFSLRMNDFGIIACLQDNGENKRFNREILGRVEGNVLHPVQFEELCARFFYSSYLFNRLPEYTLLEAPDAVYIEPMPYSGSKPLFDHWQNKTYGQVLENFWKPWGMLLLEIIRDPENPMTFLGKPGEAFPQVAGLPVSPG